jgi:mRNA degradation ribonuclease J1/J2
MNNLIDTMIIKHKAIACKFITCCFLLQDVIILLYQIMTTEAFIVHSNGPSASVQIISGETPCPSILLDPGGDPRLQAKHSNNYGHLSLGRIQPELLRRNATPLIPGLYSPDQPEHPETLNKLMTLLQTTVSAQEERAIIERGIRWQVENKVDVRAVYSSHPHFDSNLALPIIRPEIPLLASNGTTAILKAIGAIMPMVDRQFTRIRRYGEDGKLEYAERPIQVLEPGVPLEINDFGKVTTSETDHFPGSTSLDIETKAGSRLTFTGDLGAGVRTSQVLEQIVARAPETDILFLDTNNLGNAGEQRTEQGLREELGEVITTNRGMNLFVQIPRRDIGRLKQIAEVARTSGRRIVLPWQLAAYARLVAEEAPELGFEFNDVFLTPRKSATYNPKDYPPLIRDRIFDAGLHLYTPRELTDLSRKEDILTVLEDDVQFRHINPRQFLPKEKTKSQGLIYAGYQLPRSESIKLERLMRNSDTDFTNLETSGHLPSEVILDMLSQLLVRQLVPLHSVKPGVVADLVKKSGFKGNVVQNIVRNLPYGYNGRRLI